MEEDEAVAPRDGGAAITGRWMADEHDLFVKGLALYGRDWKLIQKLVPTRSIVQIRTHAQKYALKAQKVGPEASPVMRHAATPAHIKEALLESFTLADAETAALAASGGVAGGGGSGTSPRVAPRSPPLTRSSSALVLNASGGGAAAQQPQQHNTRFSFYRATGAAAGSDDVDAARWPGASAHDGSDGLAASARAPTRMGGRAASGVHAAAAAGRGGYGSNASEGAHGEWGFGAVDRDSGDDSAVFAPSPAAASSRAAAYYPGTGAAGGLPGYSSYGGRHRSHSLADDEPLAPPLSSNEAVLDGMRAALPAAQQRMLPAAPFEPHARPGRLHISSSAFNEPLLGWPGGHSGSAAIGSPRSSSSSVVGGGGGIEAPLAAAAPGATATPRAAGSPVFSSRRGADGSPVLGSGAVPSPLAGLYRSAAADEEELVDGAESVLSDLGAEIAALGIKSAPGTPLHLALSAGGGLSGNSSSSNNPLVVAARAAAAAAAAAGGSSSGSPLMSARRGSSFHLSRVGSASNLAGSSGSPKRPLEPTPSPLMQSVSIGPFLSDAHSDARVLGGGVSAGGGGSSSSSSAAGAPFVLGESLLLSSSSGTGLRDVGVVRSAGGMQQLQQQQRGGEPAIGGGRSFGVGILHAAAAAVAPGSSDGGDGTHKRQRSAYDGVAGAPPPSSLLLRAVAATAPPSCGDVGLSMDGGGGGGGSDAHADAHADAHGFSISSGAGGGGWSLPPAPHVTHASSLPAQRLHHFMAAQAAEAAAAAAGTAVTATVAAAGPATAAAAAAPRTVTADESGGVDAQRGGAAGALSAATPAAPQQQPGLHRQPPAGASSASGSTRLDETWLEEPQPSEAAGMGLGGPLEPPQLAPASQPGAAGGVASFNSGSFDPAGFLS